MIVVSLAMATCGHAAGRSSSRKPGEVQRILGAGRGYTTHNGTMRCMVDDGAS